MVHVAVPRGTSTTIHGLSRNCPDVPVSITTAFMYWIGSRLWLASPFSLLFRSMNLAINISPRFVLRLNAIPL